MVSSPAPISPISTTTLRQNVHFAKPYWKFVQFKSLPRITWSEFCNKIYRPGFYQESIYIFILFLQDFGTLIDNFEYLLPYLVPLVLFLFSISLWKFYIHSTRDPSSNLPLPPGTVGLPFVGETISMIAKVSMIYRLDNIYMYNSSCSSAARCPIVSLDSTSNPSLSWFI